LEWYQKAELLNPDGQSFRLAFAKLLLQTGNANKAEENFKLYAAIDEEISDHYLDMMEFFVSNKESNPLSGKTIAVNSSYADYAPSFFKGSLVFLSDNPEILSNQLTSMNSLYQSSVLMIVDDKSFFAKPLVDRLNLINNIGAISITDQNRCAFVSFSSSKSGALPNKCSKGSIFLADFDGKEFENIRSVPFNKLGISNVDPFLTTTGDTLYFASNMDGGYGGYDLYYSFFNGSIWSAPINLGPEVNTAGDELTPFVEKNILFFASDYHFGFGGFDLFTANNINGEWTNVLNMGSLFNSSYDEVYPYKHGDALYFSSNHASGRGSFDIYNVLMESSQLPIVFSSQTGNVETIPGSHKKDRSTIAIEKLSTLQAGEVLIEQRPIICTLQKDFAQLDMDAKESTEVIPEVFLIPDFSGIKPMGTGEYVLTGVKRVGLADFVPQNQPVYFIQLASLNSTRIDYSRYSSLLGLGRIYRFDIDGSNKIRLGYFGDRDEAERVLSNVRQRGFNDAFIVTSPLNNRYMELVLSSHDKPNSTNDGQLGNFEFKAPVANYGSSYKVRLASYEDPIWFDNAKVKDLGQIEQWTKGTWIIFVLSGYNSFDQANEARIRAVNRGFRDAEVVIDNGGILERIRQN
jgi:hypothetical protein